MMALIGFAALLIVGVIMVLAGLAAAYTTLGFSGRVEWVPTLFFCGIGGGLVYLAVAYSPIAITWSAT